jgi:hypoxanthine phosphoribosyltransferase
MKILLSFREISRRLSSLKLPDSDLVIGIGTGGIVPAALVAYKLKAELKIISMNYRDEENTPVREDPLLIAFPGDMELNGRKILLVDDVSVSGKTLQAARDLLAGYDVTTLTMKGNADYVLFPEIKECVRWPWKT